MADISKMSDDELRAFLAQVEVRPWHELEAKVMADAAAKQRAEDEDHAEQFNRPDSA